VALVARERPARERPHCFESLKARTDKMAVVRIRLLALAAGLPMARGWGAAFRSLSARQASNARLHCGLVAVVEDIWSSDESNLRCAAVNGASVNGVNGAAVNGVNGDVTTADSTDPLLNPSSDLLERATRTLDHRGPDGWHVHFGSQWGMGHTRLAIVDPANRQADMPFRLEFGNRVIHVVANGEIYNHETLYSQQANEYPRISKSDCEVIGHVYAKYGKQTPSMLDGMFALVVLEEVDGKVVNIFAARDPVGIKPLYLARTTHGNWMFASELKALVGHVDPTSVVNIPAGHYWTPDEGLSCFYNPDWLRKVRQVILCRLNAPAMTYKVTNTISPVSLSGRLCTMARPATHCH
jgi:gamma-glutamylcyclotransferase (GGCT)/AIG2-like uncharacterized protein YtfP